MTSRQKSKDSLESATTTVPYKKRKITLAILITAVSVSIAIEVGFSATFTKGYGSTTDSYKHALCTAKILELSQKGVIRDTGGFNGGMLE
ncbi:MAG: hypothetical protein M3Y53_12790, partial [Thermoproteota archaeon]|nr:hypothetical protein [Thermoproteota archaeon]